MKKILILILLLAICFSGCAPSVDDSLLTDDTAVNSNVVESNSYIVNPIINSVPVHTDEIQAFCDDSYEKSVSLHSESIGVRKWDEIIDNSTPVNDLLRKNEKKVSELSTWLLSQLVINVFDTDFREGVGTVEYIEELSGVTFSFVRTIGEYTNEIHSIPFIAMYTVLESEIGGYIYVWFDYYPETQETYLKNIAYVDKLMYVSDFSAIQEGSNIDDVIKITKTVSAQKINPEWFPLRKSQILCKDGLLTITYDEILTVTNIKVHEDFIIYSESKNTINGNWNNRNYTILPQDYPPAS